MKYLLLSLGLFLLPSIKKGDRQNYERSGESRFKNSVILSLPKDL